VYRRASGYWLVSRLAARGSQSWELEAGSWKLEALLLTHHFL
jgi:hypothetical protein